MYEAWYGPMRNYCVVLMLFLPSYYISLISWLFCHLLNLFCSWFLFPLFPFLSLICFLTRRYGVGMVYHKQEKFVLAEFHFNKALSINPQSSALLCNIGVVSRFTRHIFTEPLNLWCVIVDERIVVVLWRVFTWVSGFEPIHGAHCQATVVVEGGWSRDAAALHATSGLTRPATWVLV